MGTMGTCEKLSKIEMINSKINKWKDQAEEF
jgi:hypothetical protein